MITKPSQMTTLSSVLEQLRLKRYDNEFRMTEEGFTAGKGKYYQPEDLKVIRIYRFEGISDPADSSVIYLIEANDGLIGYSLDSFGAYSEHGEGYDDFIRRIPVDEREEANLFERNGL
ncbi:MAG: hypothetical protein ACHQET_06470 [Chitinophagales bacterium]